MKNIIVAGAVALASLCGRAAEGDLARVYVTGYGQGVYSYLVAADGTWKLEGQTVALGGEVVQVVAFLRSGAYFYALDSLNANGKFSIHRFDLGYNYVDTPVRECAIASDSSVRQFATSPDGAYLYVTQAGSSFIRVNTADWSVQTDFAGVYIANSMGICVTPSGKIYASNGNNNTVSAFDPVTGARGTMHNLAQACGAYYDPDAQLVYVGNLAHSLKVFNETDASYSGGTEYGETSTKVIENSRSIVKVGDKICMTRQRDRMIVSFDPETKQFAEVCKTSVATLYHLFSDQPYEAVVTAANGTVTPMATKAEALAVVKAAGGAQALRIVSGGTKTGSDLVFLNPAVDASAAAPVFSAGTCASRVLTDAEKAEFMSPGLKMRHKRWNANEIVYEWTDSPVAAYAYLTATGQGVKRYAVGFGDAWTDMGFVVKPNTGALKSPLSLVRVGAYFYVLDNRGTTGKFSIHRYGLDFGYVAALVSEYAEGEPNPQQIAASPDGTYLYVTTNKGLYRVKISDGTVDVLAPLNFIGLSVAPNGRIYAVNGGKGAATGLDPNTGDEVIHHHLSQGNGVFYDMDTRSVYVGNEAYSLMVYPETARDWDDADGVVYADGTIIQNSKSIVRVGAKICMTRPRDAAVVAFDPVEHGFKVVCETGWGGMMNLHIYADDPYPILVKNADGTFAGCTTFGSAMEAAQAGRATSVQFFASGYAQKPLLVTDPNVVGTADGLRLGDGTVLSRGLSVAEEASYVATGFYAKKTVSPECVTSHAVAPAGDAARAYLTSPEYGVKKYIVGSDGTWTADGDFFKVGVGGCQRPLSCVRIGRWFYVLDGVSAAYPGYFRIWRYSDKGRSRGTLVDKYETATTVSRMAASPDGTKLYVTLGSTSGKILRVDVGTGVVSVFASSGLNGASGVCVAADGTVYAVNSGNFAATGYRASDGAYIYHLAMGGEATGVWHDDDAGRLYAMTSGDYFRIFKDGQTTYATQVQDGKLSWSYALNGLGGYVFVGGYTADKIWRYEPETGRLDYAVETTGLNHATHLSFETLPAPVYPPEGLSVIVK